MDLVFHAEAGAFDNDRLGVVEEAVQDGRGDGTVVVEDAGPLFERFIGGHHDGAAFIALANDLEQQVGAVLVDGQVADLVQDQEPGAEVFLEFGFEGALFLGGAQMVDDLDGIGKENRVAFQASGVAQRRSQVGFAQADGAQKDHVGLLSQELPAEEVLDLEAIDLLGPVPMELFERFDDRKARGLDAPLDGVLEPLLVLAVDEPAEVIDVSAGLLGRLLGQFALRKGSLR